jgi:hypothetical protein
MKDIMLIKICKYISLTIVLLALPVVSLAGASLAIPEGVYYHQFISTVKGPASIWTNPAALGTGSQIKSVLIGEYADNRFADNWGFIASGDKIGLGYRRLKNVGENKFEEYTFGVGSGIGHYSFLGFSYVYTRNLGGAYHRKNFWNVGLLVASSPQMKLAAVLSNFNREKISGEKTDMGQLYGISYRPQRLPVWFTVEMSLSSGESLSSASYNYGLEGDPLPNMHAFFNYSNHGYFELGVVYYFDSFFGGTQTRIHKESGHQRTSVFGALRYTPSYKR